MLTLTEWNLLLAILLVSAFIWFLYKLLALRFLDTTLIRLPEWLQCLIPAVSSNPAHNNCRQMVDVDGWSLTHLLLFFLLGLFIPGHTTDVVVGSVIFEAAEYHAGSRARWIIDPLTNVLGYYLGMALSKRITITASWDQRRLTLVMGGALILMGVIIYKVLGWEGIGSVS